MKFTLGELKAMEGSLRILSQKELPVKTSWKISRFMKKAGEEISILEEERVKLLKQYGEEKEDKTIQVPPEKVTVFREAFVEILSQEVEIEFDPISINDLSGFNMTSAALISLDKIIEE